MPSSLNLKKGETVKVVFKNVGALPHDLAVDEIGLKTKIIKGGEADTVTFTADKTGSFEMYCSVGNHRAQGMKGPVVVQ